MWPISNKVVLYSVHIYIYTHTHKTVVCKLKDIV